MTNESIRRGFLAATPVIVILVLNMFYTSFFIAFIRCDWGNAGCKLSHKAEEVLSQTVEGLVLCTARDRHRQTAKLITQQEQALPLAIMLGLSMAAIGFNIEHDGGHKAYSNHAWVESAHSE